jgi:uncharacterized protein (DUF2132 family)
MKVLCQRDNAMADGPSGNSSFHLSGDATSREFLKRLPVAREKAGMMQIEVARRLGKPQGLSANLVAAQHSVEPHHEGLPRLLESTVESGV